MRHFGIAIAAATLLVTGLHVDPINAQIPEKFENLQVLPKDISKGDLMQNMRGFALGLGVRCWYCHVGEEGRPFSEWDFTADTKDTKKKARVMLQMRQAINGEFLPMLAERRDADIQVNCVTCHRGQPKPRMLEDVLMQEFTTSGIDGAIEKYRELRQQHYGGFAYDFGEHTLSKLAEQLQKSNQPEAAIAFLKLNLEFYPESGTSYWGLGELYAQQGDKKRALENYKKAAEIWPDNPRIRQSIEKLSEK